jgi:hypothetical protein
MGPGNHLGELEQEIGSVKALCCTVLLSIAKRYILAFSVSRKTMFIQPLSGIFHHIPLLHRKFTDILAKNPHMDAHLKSFATRMQGVILESKIPFLTHLSSHGRRVFTFLCHRREFKQVESALRSLCGCVYICCYASPPVTFPSTLSPSVGRHLAKSWRACFCIPDCS